MQLQASTAKFFSIIPVAAHFKNQSKNVFRPLLFV